MVRIVLSLFVLLCFFFSKDDDEVSFENELKTEPTYSTINADSIIKFVLKIDSQSIVEYYELDLNNDDLEDLIVLHEPGFTDERGEFRKFTIYISDFGFESYNTPDFFDFIPSTFISEKKSLVTSDLIGVYPSPYGVLVTSFGVLYGTGREPSIIVLVNSNSIQKVFEGNYDRFIGLTNLTKNQVPELIVRKDEEYWGVEDSLDIYLSSYCPYQVLTLKVNGFTLDSLNTKSYNEVNYVFEGFKYYNPEITVAVPRDGSKPYVYKAN